MAKLHDRPASAPSGRRRDSDMDADVVAAARQELDRRVTALAGASDAG
ncbi:hypothetical protein GCM10007859_27130 [Brevundimonas denitrificans]|uniref:Uncharacterized protein n=1 Tax=Brevundimonas denitrificans TaxID=1443434 RepID=A0ABQ6BM10_9CAUL|nr:hypothetical protein GCM10007859_27130 [Brevundimonas denitrificans]